MTTPTPTTLDAYRDQVIRRFEEAPAAPESFANQRFTGLLDPITGEPAATYDPEIHGGDARWLVVTCSRCERQFVNTPWDELMTPTPDLAHDGGDVCETCLYSLAARRVPTR